MANMSVLTEKKGSIRKIPKNLTACVVCLLPMYFLLLYQLDPSDFQLGIRAPHEPKVGPVKLINHQNAKKSNNTDATKYVLYYRWYSPDSWNPHSDIDMSVCPAVSDCVLTTNVSLLGSVGKFDAVVVNRALDHSTNDSRIMMPDQSDRRPSQRYIFYQKEPSAYVYRRQKLERDRWHVDQIAKLFNWSMTYDLNSDLPIPYGWIDLVGFQRSSPPTMSQFSDKWMPFNNSEVIQKFRNGDENLVRLVNRPKLVAWLTSREGARSRRDQYVTLMQEHINVDIYGGKGASCGNKQTSNCSHIIASNYKFYLAFENSFCNHYISEKFWRALSWDAIPIVMGGGGYSDVAPPHSFINVMDFATPKDLVKYIKYLDNNSEAYISYFWWKPHYKMVIGCSYERYNYAPETLAVCEMCRRLHDPVEPPSQFTRFTDLATCKQIPPNYWATRNVTNTNGAVPEQMLN